MIHTIRLVQERLSVLGFDPGPIDGVRGPRTDNAIRAFKRSIGFKDRAYLGPLTLDALFKQTPQTADLPWMAAASGILGLHEKRDLARLTKWFDKSVSWIDPRDIAWCGAFVATAHRMADPSIKIPDNPLGARNWGKFGVACQPVFGATLTFWRVSKASWQGHVGFYWGEDADAYHVLGGNQSNAVTVTRIAKKRLLESRWPAGVGIVNRPVFLDRKGLPLSENEA